MKTTLHIVLIGILLHFIVWPSQAQSVDMLIGEWSYQAVEGKETLDQQTQDMMDKLFQAFYFEFKQDGTYSARGLGKQHVGKWEVNNMFDILTLKSSTGKAFTIPILNLNDYTMTLKVSTAMVTLKKV